MRVLRVAVLTAFALSVAVTALALFVFRHVHALHIVHVVLTTATFLLIALYLLKSAEIASLTAYRELRQRLTVDSSVAFIAHLQQGSPLFNACAGALAKSGIYVKNAGVLLTVSKLEKIAATGNSRLREGYEVTKSALGKLGVKLSDDAENAAVKIALGAFAPELDAAITQNKVTHLLKLVYIARVYEKSLRRARIFAICAAVAAAGLLAFGQFTYAGAAIALWAAGGIFAVRDIERKTAKLSFEKIGAGQTKSS
jgi:uncharacterized membrane protein